MWKFYFSTLLLLPQMDGWMADDDSEMVSECLVSISLQLDKEQLSWKGKVLQLVCSDVNK